MKSIEKKVVKYWAERCGPCRMIWPVLTELSKQYPDIEYVSKDVDDNQAEALEKWISSIPVVIFYENDVEVRRLQWAMQPEVYWEMFNTLNNK